MKGGAFGGRWVLKVIEVGIVLLRVMMEVCVGSYYNCCSFLDYVGLHPS